MTCGEIELLLRAGCGGKRETCYCKEAVDHFALGFRPNIWFVGGRLVCFLPTIEFYCTRNLVRYWLFDLDAFSGPEYGSVDDLEDFGLVIGWVGFVSGAEVHDSTDSFAVVDSVAWA